MIKQGNWCVKRGDRYLDSRGRISIEPKFMSEKQAMYRVVAAGITAGIPNAVVIERGSAK